MLKVFVDTDCDITPEFAKENGFELISMPYIIGDKTIFPYKDFKVFNAEEYYNSLREGVLLKTCAINQEEYKAYFEPHFANGDDIFYIHFSLSMSGTFNSMNLAVNELLEKYPGRKFYSFDTKGITTISYCLIQEFAKLYKQGKTAEEMIEWGHKNVDRYAVYFYAEDLKFFARSGRVSGFAGFFGNMIGIKPIIYMNENGQMVSISKARGTKNAIDKILGYVRELEDDILNHKVYVANTGCINSAKAMIAALKKEFGEELDCEIVDVNPTAGAHCGPGCVGVCFHSKHR